MENDDLTEELATLLENLKEMSTTIPKIHNESLFSLLKDLDGKKCTHQQITSIYEDTTSILKEVPLSNYLIYRDTTNALCNLLDAYGKGYNYILKYFNNFVFDITDDTNAKLDVLLFFDIYVFVMKSYLLLAERLELLGFAGEAFEYLLRSIDPWYKKYNKYDRTGDLSLKNSTLFDQAWYFHITIGVDGTREMFLRRASSHLRVLSVLGLLDDSGTSIYITTNSFLNMGLDASLEDINLMCSYAEYIYLKEPKSATFFNLQKLLIDQFHIETSRPFNYGAFYIAYSLTKMESDPRWVSTALKTPLPPNCQELYYILQIKFSFITGDIDEELHHMLLIGMLSSLSKKFPNRILFEMQKQRFSEFFTLLIVLLLNHDKPDLAVRYAYIWKTFIPGNEISPSLGTQSLIVLVSNLLSNINKYLIYSGGHTQVIEVKGNTTFDVVLQYKNKIESGWDVRIGQQEIVPKLDTQIHVDASEAYQSAIEDHYGINKIVSLLNSKSERQHFRFIDVVWTNVPVLPLIRKDTNHLLSYAVSHEALNWGEIKKVLLWSDPDMSLQYSFFETEALKQILGKKAIVFECYEGEQCTKELFIEKYIDSTFDVIWIMSHGEFISDDPPQTKLTISSEHSITPWELERYMPQREERRQLVLNACQSGASTIRYNSMGFTGLGHVLTNRYQSVIGHLWYADSLASSIIGVITLYKVLNGESWQIALKESQELMLDGNTALVKYLKEIDGDIQLADRVSNNISKDLHNLYYSGSAIMFT